MRCDWPCNCCIHTGGNASTCINLKRWFKLRDSKAQGDSTEWDVLHTITAGNGSASTTVTVGAVNWTSLYWQFNWNFCLTGAGDENCSLSSYLNMAITG